MGDSTLNGIQEDSTLNGIQEDSTLNGIQEDSTLNGIQEDSTLNGIQEDKMCSTQMINVRVFPWACVTDFYNSLEPLMERKPSKLIIHTGTNDAIEKDVDQIFNELLNLKSYVNVRFPNCNDTISCPTLRVDNIKARNTVAELGMKLKELKILNIGNTNIT